MNHGRAKFQHALSQTRQATALCLNDGLWLPTLVLIYAFVDAMAWLARPAQQDDVKGKDFISWCDKYVLLPQDSECSGLDLYAARCGILHSNVAESKLMREGTARPLWYELPNGETLAPLMTASLRPATRLRLQPFVARVCDAAESFMADVDNVPDLGDLVWKRADLYYDKGVMTN